MQTKPDDSYMEGILRGQIMAYSEAVDKLDDI